MGLSRLKRRVWLVYQGLREGKDRFTKVKEKDRIVVAKEQDSDDEQIDKE